MGTIMKRGAKFRAQVFVRGARAGATFGTKKEAQEWIAREEHRIRQLTEMPRLAIPKPDIETIIRSGALRKRQVAAVYFLFSDDLELVYVGSTKDLYRRITNHCEDGRDFQSWAAIEVMEDEDRLALEAHYIQKYAPAQNKIRPQRRMITRHCVVCLRSFKSPDGKNAYCSDACRETRAFQRKGNVINSDKTPTKPPTG
jgi:predicted GIY-YIG superfamily endonuclease